MTTVDIPEKQHRKLKKEALKRNIDLKDLVSEKLGLIIIGAMLVPLLAFTQATYADHDVPFDFWDSHACTFEGTAINSTHMEYGFYCNWQGIFEQLTKDWQKIVPTEDGNYTHNLAGAIIIQAPDGSIQEKIIEIVEEIDPDAERRAIIDERRAEEAAETEQLIGKLAECRTGLGAFAAYQEQAPIEDYANQTRWQFAIRDNLSQSGSLLNILKAIEECDIMKEYVRQHLITERELNMYLADQAGTDYLGRTQEHPLNPSITDQSDAMVETDPVTDKDIADEVSEAEELRDRLIAERVFEDPDADFKGINRGGQPEGLKCQVHGQPAPVGAYPADVCPLSLYDTHILTNWEAITYGDILELQCKHFLYIYVHKVGTHEFPVWLNHCVPKVVRNG